MLVSFKANMDYPGEKLIIKIWETLVEKGIGAALTPWHEKRLGEARNSLRKNEILLLAQAEMTAEEIRQGKIKLLEDGTIKKESPDNTIIAEHILDVAKVIDHAEASKKSNTIREEINISKSIIFAEEELADDTQEPPAKKIDADWIYRWKDNASKVSSEKLQQLWGKLLAGEFKSPGKYSLRTQEFLKNLSQDEARLIEKVAQFNIDGQIVRDEKKILEDNGITFDSILFLQELDILVGVESVGMSVEYKSNTKDSFQKYLISNGRVLIIKHKNVDQKLSLSIYAISNIGKQILSLGTFESNKEYLVSIGKKLANKGFEVVLGDWIPVDEKHGKISNQINIKKEDT